MTDARKEEIKERKKEKKREKIRGGGFGKFSDKVGKEGLQCGSGGLIKSYCMLV
ncbi:MULTISPECIES: hypothetical protein [unclassified Providencia]|uniref:hypothetical protein n=1 Tax=unclassified Providencia TaxID=2633465 RepID=UPI0023493BD0|nr:MULTISPECIES: hypothetical protein [unclassified Providencia]WOB81677.1 hypothetical protein P3L37_18635 [Providencia sp. PROV114]